MKLRRSRSLFGRAPRRSLAASHGAELSDSVSAAQAPGTATLPAIEEEPGPAAPRAEAIVEARGIEKSFRQPEGRTIQVIAATSLALEAGSITALLGPSGSGKSTLLRMLSGLTEPSSGEVLWHGRPLAQCAPNVAIVFQSFALFPWLTVLENVEAPLLARGMEHRERHQTSIAGGSDRWA